MIIYIIAALSCIVAAVQLISKVIIVSGQCMQTFDIHTCYVCSVLVVMVGSTLLVAVAML